MMLGALRGDRRDVIRRIIGVVVLIAATVIAARSASGMADADTLTVAVVTVLAGSAVTLGFAVGPPVTASVDPLDPRRFAVVGPEPRPLAGALLLAGFLSVPVLVVLVLGISLAISWGAHGATPSRASSRSCWALRPVCCSRASAWPSGRSCSATPVARADGCVPRRDPRRRRAGRGVPRLPRMARSRAVAAGLGGRDPRLDAHRRRMGHRPRALRRSRGRQPRRRRPHVALLTLAWFASSTSCSPPRVDRSPCASAEASAGSPCSPEPPRSRRRPQPLVLAARSPLPREPRHRAHRRRGVDGAAAGRGVCRSSSPCCCPCRSWRCSSDGSRTTTSPTTPPPCGCTSPAACAEPPTASDVSCRCC